MPIVIDCECGKKLKVPDEHAGKRVRCPSCSEVVAVPGPAPISATPPRPSSSKLPGQGGERNSPSGVSARKASPPQDTIPLQTDDFDFEDSEKPVRKATGRRSRVVEDDEEVEEVEYRPRRGRSKEALGSLLGGLAMMVGAVVWFFVGLAGGIIFFYPPILFILGVGAFIRGMMGRD